MSAGPASPILRLLRSGAPGTELARAIAVGEDWLPCFLGEADNIPAGPRPYHSGSVLRHTVRCMNSVAGDELAVWMALAHDSGKLTTPAALLPHHYGHELRGKELATVWALQLGLPDSFLRAGVMAALLHMKAGRYTILRPGKKFDLLNAVAASGFFSSFWKVVDADTRSDISSLAVRDWQSISELADTAGQSELTRQQGIAMLLGNA